MVLQTEARIYLADQRGCSQDALHRSFHVFNFGNYQHAHRQPFNGLDVLNDDTLRGSAAAKYSAEAGELTLVIPIVGECAYSDSSGMRMTLDVGQCYIGQGKRNVEITNPYDDELINYLYVSLKGDLESGVKHWLVDFDLHASSNRLVPLFNRPTIALGKFGGRQEGTYIPSNPDKGVFLFVLEGAFEVQNRLLQPRDGLALWNADEIEFEALSNDAILLVIDQHG